MTIKKLILNYPAHNNGITGYEIERVVGSVEYKPGQFLTHTEVEKLCEPTSEWMLIMGKQQ